MIFGGIRTAVVMNIGVMAIAAVIGAGGLGLLLLNGISSSDIRQLITGAVMISLLAIVLDWLLHRLQIALTPKDPLMIKLENLTKQFMQKNGTPFNAVDNINLDVPEGEICVLLGPSGCGKTTTLKMINRLIEPTGGTILINGEDTSALDTVSLRRKIGYVIQQIGLFPNMTIEENITVVPRMLGWDKNAATIAPRS